MFVPKSFFYNRSLSKFKLPQQKNYWHRKLMTIYFQLVLGAAKTLCYVGQD